MSLTEEPSREPERARRHLFPPALVPILRRVLGPVPMSTVDVSDELLAELLTVIFFAGFETVEGEHHPIRVVFVGRSRDEWVAPSDTAGPAGPIYRWSSLRFATPRPFRVEELTKLAVASTSERMYTRVRLRDGVLQICGLAREGFNYEGDPFLKIVSIKPGALWVRRGHERVLEYEGGAVLTRSEDIVRASGPVRRALELFAQQEHLGGEAASEYLETTRAIVREMPRHGHGGILVIGPRSELGIDELAGYKTHSEVSLAELLRQLHGYGPRRRGAGLRSAVSLGEVLRGALLSEAESTVEELGSLTAIDGAAMLDRGLSLVGFGVVLPVTEPGAVLEAQDAEGASLAPFDLHTRGTRHRAAATYARSHPGCIVFVASQDGEIVCMYRDKSWEQVVAWRFAAKP